MKAAIFSFVKVSENSMVASVRIARHISETFGMPIHVDDHIADKPLDLLVVVNGAYAFSKHLEPFARAVKEAKRVVWVQNDYTIIPPKIESQGVSPFRAAFRERHEAGKPHMDFWTTCEDWQRFTPHSRYVNWNALTFDETAEAKKLTKRRKHSGNSLFYYGSFRGGGGKSSRQVYFDRYFLAPEVETIISSPAKQFRERYTSNNVSHVDAIKSNFYETLAKHGMGLYIEDRMSHERFHSPANRFYEMLSAGLPMVFQPECGTMLRRAGFDPTPYTARNSREVARLMEQREDIRTQQWNDWVYKRGSVNQFRDQLNSSMVDAFSVQQELLR